MPRRMRPLLALAPALVLALLTGCTSSGNGTLAVRATDAPDNLGDFSSLNVTVSSITLTKSDGGTKDYAPSAGTFDLTKLTSGNTTTLFSGAVDNGNYTKLTLHVGNGAGTLTSGAAQSVKAPGDQLFLTSPFEVASGKTTTFTFDIQVVKRGNGDYNFQPNADASGPR